MIGNRGYSLMEIVVVLIIISLLFMVSLYGFKGIIKRMKVENSVRTICGVIRFANYKSRSDGVPVKVKFDKGQLIVKSFKKRCWSRISDLRFESFIEVVNRGGPVFYPDGSVVPTGSFFVSTNKGNRSYKITISSLGRIKVVKSVT